MATITIKNSGDKTVVVLTRTPGVIEGGGDGENHGAGLNEHHVAPGASVQTSEPILRIWALESGTMDVEFDLGG